MICEVVSEWRIQQDKISVTLLQNHILKSRKRRTIFTMKLMIITKTHTQERKASKRKKHSKRKMQFRSTCIVGVETILNLKSDGKIGQRPNVDKKNAN